MYFTDPKPMDHCVLFARKVLSGWRRWRPGLRDAERDDRTEMTSLTVPQDLGEMLPRGDGQDTWLPSA